MEGNEHAVRTTKEGEFWRLLLPGSYQVKAFDPKTGRNSTTKSIYVPQSHVTKKRRSNLVKLVI